MLLSYRSLISCQRWISSQVGIATETRVPIFLTRISTSLAFFGSPRFSSFIHTLVSIKVRKRVCGMDGDLINLRWCLRTGDIWIRNRKSRNDRLINRPFCSVLHFICVSKNIERVRDRREKVRSRIVRGIQVIAKQSLEYRISIFRAFRDNVIRDCAYEYVYYFFRVIVVFSLCNPALLRACGRWHVRSRQMLQETKVYERIHWKYPLADI